MIYVIAVLIFVAGVFSVGPMVGIELLLWALICAGGAYLATRKPRRAKRELRARATVVRGGIGSRR